MRWFCFIISSIPLIPKSTITVLNRSPCLTCILTKFNLTRVQKDAALLLSFYVFVFAWMCTFPPQKKPRYSLSPAIWSCFFTLTRSRCRLTTASESRLRHYRWVVLSQWPAWCVCSFESSNLTEIYGSLSKEELCDVALGLVGEIVFICRGDRLCVICGTITVHIVRLAGSKYTFIS